MPVSLYSRLNYQNLYIHSFTPFLISNAVYLNIKLIIIINNNYYYITNFNMAECVTKDIMLQSRFTLIGKLINEKYNKTNEWIKKNALRELNQKRIKSNR